MNSTHSAQDRQPKRTRRSDDARTDSTKRARYRNRSKDYKHKWSVFKAQAKKRHIEQELDLEQYLTLIQMPCTYCGKGVLQDNTGMNSESEFVGIDRIDSDKRKYCLSNCVPCCSACNFMKGSLPHRIFLSQVRAIAKWRTGVEF